MAGQALQKTTHKDKAIRKRKKSSDSNMNARGLG